MALGRSGIRKDIATDLRKMDAPLEQLRDVAARSSNRIARACPVAMTQSDTIFPVGTRAVGDIVQEQDERVTGLRRTRAFAPLSSHQINVER